MRREASEIFKARRPPRRAKQRAQTRRSRARFLALKATPAQGIDSRSSGWDAAPPRD